MVVLEGFHAVKHAIRFGAAVTHACSPDGEAVAALAAKLAPDVADHPAVCAPRMIDAAAWNELTAGRDLPSPLLALAPRPTWTTRDVARRSGRVVVLDNPRHHGNVGAAIRVAAAADAAGVVVLGGVDPWHAAAVRGAAGLQLALPVIHVDATDALAMLDTLHRPTIAVDPTGTPEMTSPHDAALVFGTERAGLSPQLRDRCDELRAIPMRAGVSSLNLATAVAVMCYADVANGRA